MNLPPRKVAITRIEAFSDGMIAFAATLLVVSLDAPRTYEELINNVYGFVPFGISFAALFYMWFVHTILFRRYPLSDGVSIMLNGAWLFTILFYVYPLKFMAGSFVSLFTQRAGAIATSWGQLQSLFIIYAAGWIVVFIIVSALYHRAYATREVLRLAPLEAYDAVTWSRHYLGFVAAGVLSVLVALSGVGVSVGLPGIAYASIGLFAYLNSKNREPGRQQLATRISEHPQLADTMAIDASMIRDALR